ncbi:MAG: phosphoribosyltransferase family protein, partial [Fuerstiella sp.]
ILLEHAADGTKIIVYPPPFINIPTAGYFLTLSFFNTLNRQLFSVGCSPILLGKVWREKSYFTDYSRLSKAERENVFADEVFTTDTELLRSAYALFVDDIRITGAHENRILRMTDELGLARGQIAMLHYARMQIPNLDPAIEDRMNSAAMADLTYVTEMINRNDFRWNTRVTKHVLSLPPVSFAEFVESIRSPDRVRLLDGALSNGYGYLPEFQGNVERLLSLLQQ